MENTSRADEYQRESPLVGLIWARPTSLIGVKEGTVKQLCDNVPCDHASIGHHHCSSDTTSPQWRELYEIADDVILPALGSPDLNHALEQLLDLVGEIANKAEEQGRQQRTGAFSEPGIER
jgi:hypothetical protein